jgi:hypothetical protein
MALGESQAALVEIITRELVRAGDGALEPDLARRIAAAVSAAIEENNYAIELKLTQQLQTAGLQV